MFQFLTDHHLGVCISIISVQGIKKHHKLFS